MFHSDRYIGFLRLLIPFMVLLLVHQKAFSQSDRLLKKAEKEFYEENFREAMALYQEVLEEKPNHRLSQYHIEICSLLLDHPFKPLDDLLAFENTMARGDKFYYYWLGRAYRNQHRLEESIGAFEDFLKAKGYKSDIIKGETRDFIASLKRALAQKESPTPFTLVNERPWDSDKDEFSPVIVSSNSIVLSRGSFHPRAMDKFKGEQLLYFKRDASGNFELAKEWSVAQAFGQDWAMPVAFDGPNQLLIVHTAKKGGMYEQVKFVNGNLGSVEKLAGGLTKAKYPSGAALSPDGKIMIFTSRKGTNSGDLDLFISFKDNKGRWSKAEALPPEVNTIYDEDTPSWNADGSVLYFSSNGHTGLGGMDLYEVSYDQEAKEWGTPQLMGYPFNSVGNDMGLVFSPDGKEAFFISFRPEGKGSLTLYHVRDGRVDAPQEKPQVELARESSANEVPPASSPAPEKMGSGKSEVQAQAKGEKPAVEATPPSPSQAKPEQGPAKTSPQMKEKKEPAVTKAKKETVAMPVKESYMELEWIANKFRPGAKAILRNVYFDLNKATLTKDSFKTLDVLVDLMNDHPGLQIEIAGHADGTGSDKGNQKLSEQRANAVKRYLSKAKIDGSRIIAIGYGSTKPLASNDDEKEGRALNRRIEIIVKETNMTSLNQ